MKTFSFKTVKENAISPSPKDSTPTQLDFEDATVNLTDENGIWFSHQDDMVRAGLYGKWRHDEKDVIDFDKWLTIQRESQRGTTQA